MKGIDANNMLCLYVLHSCIRHSVVSRECTSKYQNSMYRPARTRAHSNTESEIRVLPLPALLCGKLLAVQCAVWGVDYTH